jgi:hypothetical protein
VQVLTLVRRHIHNQWLPIAFYGDNHVAAIPGLLKQLCVTNNILNYTSIQTISILVYENVGNRGIAGAESSFAKVHVDGEVPNLNSATIEPLVAARGAARYS